VKIPEVAKLNGRGGGSDVATFLGSSQSDPSAEARALSGAYRLVYVTPEKLTGEDGAFLGRLANMHTNGGGRGGSSGKICLFAVDESHCVSEWGHDFRPAFLRIGPAIRDHPILRSIPILALTATAVPRVRDDILANLQMKRDDTTIVKRSFDRTNLKIVVRGRPIDGITGAFGDIATELAGAIIAKRCSGKSTIVYCSTKREVEDVAARITQLLTHELARLMHKQQQQQSTAGASLDRASELARNSSRTNSLA
jgi:ATP-dependent DNA helicase RecQ